MTGMKKMLMCLSLCVLFAFIINGASAQSMLPVQGKAPNYFITYKVQPKETLSGIGRTFGVSVGDIMRINGMHTNSKLMVGEDIKIPLNAKNVKQSKDGDAIALVHVVEKGETLYRISVNHNKVPVDLLKQWNNLGDKPIEIGQDIIIGYLQPNGNVNLPVIATESPRKPQPKKEVVKEDVKNVVDNSPTAPANTQKETVTTPDTGKNIEQQSSITTPAETKPEEKPVAKSTPKTIDLSNVGAEGYFAPMFGKDVEGRDLRSATGTAGTFKTASGWADKKYYILMNDIPPGSIVKVSSGDKAIYAKVLWGMGTMKENEGLNYRISNAAASALGISDSKFDIVVVYYE